MFFTSIEQAFQIEQSKFYTHTGTWPKSYPYLGVAAAALARGDREGAALHLSSLVRLNADLYRLRTTAPTAFDHFVNRWREVVGTGRVGKNAALHRGWRVELLAAAELANSGILFELSDTNPRALQGMPDIVAHQAGVEISIECGSVKPDASDNLSERVYKAAWNKKYDRHSRKLRDWVGEDALLLLDITSVAANFAASSGGNADLDVFSRSVIRSVIRRTQRFGTDWGAVVLHFAGVYAEPELPEITSLRLERPAWGVTTNGSSVILSETSAERRIVNRSFYSLIRNRSSQALDELVKIAFPMTEGHLVAHLEHLPWSIVY